MTELIADAFRTIATDDVIPNEYVISYYLDDRKLRVPTARVDDRLSAFDDLCTYSDLACPLSAGVLIGAVLMCHRHGSRFDVTTGAVINGPATEPLKRYELREVAGRIEIRA